MTSSEASLTLALDSEHQLSFVYMLDEFMGSPVVALGTNRPVQLKGVGVEAAETKPETTIVHKRKLFMEIIFQNI